MKRCPTCGNTYTNDQLVFCLEDGAALFDVRDARQSFDPDATLRISGEENILPPAAADFKPQGAPTHRQSPPLTAPPRTPQATSDQQAPVAAVQPSSKSTSPVIVAGITAIVVLLLVIAGIGVALLVRSSSSGNVAANTESGNGAANRESSRNASNTASDNGAMKPASSNKATANNTDGNTSAATTPAGRAEAKVVRGAALNAGDLTNLSGEELRRLRNSVYARHGRTFDSAELQRYFDSRPWYKARADYNESELTEADRANIQLIQTEESSR
jgi:hypothetical protein